MKVYFDIGANSGDSMLHHAGDDAIVYAFEPTPKLVDTLTEKTKDIKNYHIVDKAVADYNGKSTFFISGVQDWGCSSLNTFNDDLDKTWPGRTGFEVTDRVEVDVIRLDGFIEEHDIREIEFFHCSAQSKDMEVLMGMGMHLRKVKQGQISLPIRHDTKLYKDSKYVSRDAILFLEQGGFRVDKTLYNDYYHNEERILFSRIGDLPEEIKPGVPEEIKPDVPEEIKTDVPEEIKTDVPEEIKTDVPEEIKPDVPEEIKTDVPEEIKPDVPEEIKPDVPEEIKTDVPEEIKTDVPEVQNNTGKLRVAVVFSGRATCYDESYEWFKKFSDKYAVDFYCSISTELDEHYQRFIDLYKIKKYIFGNKITCENFTGRTNSVSMFYNLKSAVDLISLDDYDVVLYARADTVCAQDIDMSVAAHHPNRDNVVFIPTGFDYGGLNDQMAFGAPKAMFKYSRVFDNIDEYVQTGKIGSDVHPETTLKAHVDAVGLMVERFDLNYCLNLKRYEYEIQKGYR